MSSPDDPEYNDDPYKFYFQIDTEWIQKYMDSLINKLSESCQISLPVSSWLPSIAEESASLYLGNNYYNEGVWKKVHFVKDNLTIQYKQHLNANATHILQQPNYHKGMYDIQN